MNADARSSDFETWCGDHATTQLWVWIDGEPVVERCFGDTGPGHTRDVGSIQKNVICAVIAVLAERDEIDIDLPMSTWLGRGWTRATADDEDLITMRSVMSMTTGLHADLTLEAAPGEVWTYNNPAYHLVKKALAEISGSTTQGLCEQLVFGPLGMTDCRWYDRPGASLPGGWPVSGLLASARDLARFGTAMLDLGTELGADTALLAEATSSSQELNPSWGLLWWDLSAPRALLLGHRPGEPVDPLNPLGRIPIERRIAPDAPPDTFAGLGIGDQRLYVAPSRRAVVVRLGDPISGGTGQARSIDVELWSRLELTSPALAPIRKDPT